MNKKKILHLTLKKKWFDMIASGEKKEEYREIKPYWQKRLLDEHYYDFKKFDEIIATNGYAKNARKIKWEHKGISVSTPKEGWVDPCNEMNDYYTLYIGQVTRLNF